MSRVEGVVRAFLRIRHACRPLRVASAVDEEGVSAHQAEILAHLDPVDPTMVGELAGHMGVTPSTMSLNLKRLEAAGYVKRDRDPVDRRVVNVRLTEAGTAIRDAREVLDPMRVADLLQLLDPEDRGRGVEGIRLLGQAADELVRRGRSGEGAR